MENAKKEFTLTLRITSAEREKLKALVARVKAKDKRAEASEVFRELLGLNGLDLTTEEDRRSLSGLPIEQPVAPSCCPDHAELHARLTALLHSPDYRQEAEWLRGNILVFTRNLPPVSPPERKEFPVKWDPSDGSTVRLPDGRKLRRRKRA